MPKTLKLIEKIKESSKNFDSSQIKELEKEISRIIDTYAPYFQVPPHVLLEALENKREISAPNFYSYSNFPNVYDIAIFENHEALVKAVDSKGFRCPACKGISTDPYDCNTKIIKGDFKDGKKRECNWKAYGLFRAGFAFTLSDRFLDNPLIDHIFIPVAFETDEKLDIEKINRHTLNKVQNDRK